MVDAAFNSPRDIIVRNFYLLLCFFKLGVKVLIILFPIWKVLQESRLPWNGLSSFFSRNWHIQGFSRIYSLEVVYFEYLASTCVFLLHLIHLTVLISLEKIEKTVSIQIKTIHFMNNCFIRREKQKTLQGQKHDQLIINSG